MPAAAVAIMRRLLQRARLQRERKTIMISRRIVAAALSALMVALLGGTAYAMELSRGFAEIPWGSKVSDHAGLQPVGTSAAMNSPGKRPTRPRHSLRQLVLLLPQAEPHPAQPVWAGGNACPHWSRGSGFPPVPAVDFCEVEIETPCPV